MKILIVSATKFEIQPLLDAMDDIFDLGPNMLSCKLKNNEIDVLITGIGMVATTYHCAKKINSTYDFVLNVGICGSFNEHLEIGTLVNIVQDHFSELGAEDGEQFLTIKEIGFDGEIEIFNETIIANETLNEIPKVCGITVNTTHGNETSIEKVFNKFYPNTESMEGAAFMFVCEQEKVKYAQVRAVSNLVEKRNKANWDIPLAIKNLNEKLLAIISSTNNE